MLQILAYVSQVHGVVLPDGVVDHETLTLDQVCLFNICSVSLVAFQELSASGVL